MSNKGILYVVSTPIGNLEDITPRAVRILSEVDLIAAEDTRHSRGLLLHFNIDTPLYSCHKFNESKRVEFFVNALCNGKNIALISDAGTPCISDPGHILVKTAAENGITIVPVGGISAVTVALSVCGFDTSDFIFIGFLPRGKDLLERVESVLSVTRTAVFYESPKRIISTIKMLATRFYSAEVCLCNDLSKKFERIYRGGLSDVLEQLESNENAERGEYTCVFQLPVILTKDEAKEEISLEAELVDVMIKTNCTAKEAVTKVAQKRRDVSKKDVYTAMLRLREIL